MTAYEASCEKFARARYGYEPLLTNRVTTDPKYRCAAMYQTSRCQRPVEHDGLHQTLMRAIEWEDGDEEAVMKDASENRPEPIYHENGTVTVDLRDVDQLIFAVAVSYTGTRPGESVVVRAAPHLLDLLERARTATVFHTAQAQPQPPPTEEKAHDEND